MCRSVASHVAVTHAVFYFVSSAREEGLMEKFAEVCAASQAESLIKVDVWEAAAGLPQTGPISYRNGVNSILSEQYSLNTRHDKEQEARP